MKACEARKSSVSAKKKLAAEERKQKIADVKARRADAKWTRDYARTYEYREIHSAIQAASKKGETAVSYNLGTNHQGYDEIFRKSKVLTKLLENDGYRVKLERNSWVSRYSGSGDDLYPSEDTYTGSLTVSWGDEA